MTHGGMILGILEEDSAVKKVQEKTNPFEVYVGAIKIFFYVAALAIIIYIILANILLPDERDTVPTKCRVFEAQWEQVLENGEKVPVQVPGKVEAEWGEVVTIATTLPEEIQNGEYLCFHSIWQDVEIYIDGNLRQSYTTKESRPFGKNSTTRFIFAALNEEDEGKELTYCFSSYSKYAGDMQSCYIGDRASIWTYLINRSGARTAVALLLILLSLFCIVVCLIMRLVYKRDFVLKYLAWALFFCAVWMLSETDFRQIIVPNVSSFVNIAYWSLMLIPFPLMIYMNEIQEKRYKKMYACIMTYSVITLIVTTILQISDLVQFVQLLSWIHLGLIAAMIGLIVTIAIDIFKKRISEYLLVGIGISGLLLAAVLEMIIYYAGAGMSLGAILGVGLLFLLITAVMKMGEDLAKSEKKKQQAIAGREAQAKFLASMSHEIRTPINIIVGMNEMILRENENPAVKDYAHNIQNASNMLLGLINDVLDFSKIESGQLELVEKSYRLASLIQDGILILNTRVGEKSISTQIDVDSGLPSGLWGDELRIRQVLTNLLSNAVKYTEKGSITLKAFYEPIDESHIKLCFSVTDTGVGIKGEDMPKLFDSFKRLDLEKNQNIQGTGLGLNIAKQLVEQMNGKIAVESEYGKGSTFSIFIPQKVMDSQPIGNLADSVQRERKKQEKPKELFTAPDAHVLVVDDNPVNLSLVKGLLKRTQIRVDLAKSGKQSLAFTRKKKYDIIFMDHMMPEMDGVETLHILREEEGNPNKDGIVIALTANAIAGCRERYLGYGFNDYFAKPIQADKLEEMLMEYLPSELVRRSFV